MRSKCRPALVRATSPTIVASATAAPSPRTASARASSCSRRARKPAGAPLDPLRAGCPRTEIVADWVPPRSIVPWPRSPDPFPSSPPCWVNSGPTPDRSPPSSLAPALRCTPSAHCRASRRVVSASRSRPCRVRGLDMAAPQGPARGPAPDPGGAVPPLGPIGPPRRRRGALARLPQLPPLQQRAGVLQLHPPPARPGSPRADQEAPAPDRVAPPCPPPGSAACATSTGPTTAGTATAVLGSTAAATRAGSPSCR